MLARYSLPARTLLLAFLSLMAGGCLQEPETGSSVATDPLDANAPPDIVWLVAGSEEYDEGEFLGKTAGFGSDYKILRGAVHARYPIPMGDDSEITFVPLAGLGYYRWTENDCVDTFDAGFCDPYTAMTLDFGAEVKWRQFGFKFWVPLNGDAPDYALRVRYHVPIGNRGR